MQQVYCTDGADVLLAESGGVGSEGDEAARLAAAEERRGGLAEGGAGNLLVLTSLSEHRLQKHVRRNAVISDLVSAYPDVLKVS